MTAKSADIQLELKSIIVSQHPEFVVSSKSNQSHTIVSGWLTEGTRAPCTGGVHVEDILIDGSSAASTRLLNGEHELRVIFKQLKHEFELNLVLDLQIDEGECARVPVVSQSIPNTAQKRLAVVVGMPIEGHGALSGSNGYVAGTVGAGGWLGSTLITGAVGVGGDICNKNTCGETSDGRTKRALALPSSLLAQYYPTFSSNAGFLVTPFIGARYSFVPAWLNTLDGKRQIGLHGLHAYIGWGIGDGTPGPFQRMERSQLMEIGIPVGVWFDPTSSSNRFAFGAGFELRFRIVP